MHLICLPLWFIMVDSCSVLHCLKIDPQWKPGNQCPCSHLLLHLWLIVLFLYLSLTHFLIAASVCPHLCFLLLIHFPLWLPPPHQLPFGEGLFHFYPQDTSKRRSKRSARSRQQLQKDRRVSIHAGMNPEKSTLNVSCTHVHSVHGSPFTLHDNGHVEARIHVEYSANKLL